MGLSRNGNIPFTSDPYGVRMPSTFVVRVWMPDRPGALGQVAGRIGAVRGDVASIEVLERGGGRAIDEIVVELPDASLVDALIREIDQVEGVDVEEVRPVDGGHLDPWLDAVQTASRLVETSSYEELIDELVDHCHRGVAAEWAAVLDLATGQVVGSRGPIPTLSWLTAFVDGSRHSQAGHVGLGDVTWAPLTASDHALVIGRDGSTFRAKERQQVAALARIADAWLAGLREIRRLNCRLAHPSYPGPTPTLVGPPAATG